ncbi:YrzA family protein [Anaerobacillus sp. MEB173]|uniref:YrzA family protein n=1 Tax=Anaerobacillus sp. MEB173 TaxID=3383345 RepID=UPI003F92B7B5
MEFKLERIDDKVEFFEAKRLNDLEKQINQQIENNKVLLLEVFHVSHQVQLDPSTSQKYYSAVVHFKAKK